MTRPCAKCKNLFEHRGAAKYCSKECQPYKPKNPKDTPQLSHKPSNPDSAFGIYGQRWELLWNRYPQLHKVMMAIEEETR